MIVGVEGFERCTRKSTKRERGKLTGNSSDIFLDASSNVGERI